MSFASAYQKHSKLLCWEGPEHGSVTADKSEPSTLLLDAVGRAPLGLVQASLTVPSPLPCVNGVLSQSSPETLFVLEQHCK